MAEKTDDISHQEWTKMIKDVHLQRADMNRLIMDYLVCEGFKEAAEKFKVEAGLEPHQPLEQLDNRIKIREAIQNGDIEEAICLTNAINPDILDTRPELFFHLQQQRLIELIRDRNLDQALAFSQNVMSEIGTEDLGFLDELERTMALLAYESPESSPFGELLHLAQRQKVASELNAAILEDEHQETKPKLANVLKVLLWVQAELDIKKIKYPKMVDLASGTIESSR